MTDEEDPLANADIGDETGVETSYTVRPKDALHANHGASDRHLTIDTIEVDETRDEWAEPILKVTVDGRAIKRLPHHWEYCTEPRTRTENRAAVLSKWGNRLLAAIAFSLPFALAALLFPYIDTTVRNAVPGYTPTTLGVFELAPLVVLTIVIALAIQYAPAHFFNGGSV